MYVVKFEGAFAESPEALFNFKKIVESKSLPVVVVAAPLNSITDRIKAMFAIAMRKGEGFHIAFEGFKKSLETWVKKYIEEERQSVCLSAVEECLERLFLTLSCNALLKEYKPEAKDYVLCLGGKLSALLLSYFLHHAICLDVGDFICTDGKLSSASMLREESCRSIVANFDRLLGVAVVAGGYGRSVEGVNTVLTAEDSEAVASVIAEALQAETEPLIAVA